MSYFLKFAFLTSWNTSFHAGSSGDRWLIIIKNGMTEPGTPAVLLP
jgi:hypothetical protein